jgi:Zinc knuckle
MDTSAVARKANSEDEKKKHREQGRYFKCSQQGHIARNCPNKQSRARTADIYPTPEIEKPQKAREVTPKSMASYLKGLSEEDKDTFIRAMQEEGEDMGFLDA